MQINCDNILSAVSANLLDFASLSQSMPSIYRFGKPFVSIQEFLEDDYYFGKIAKDLYPDNLPDLLDIFNPSKNYIEIILTGATSIGKTFLACIAMSYIIGQVGSYLNPHTVIGGSSTSPIVFVNMSISAKKSKEVVFTRVKTMIDSSPYFREKFKRDLKLFDSLTWRLSPDQEDVEARLGSAMTFKPGTGDSLSALGDDIYAGIGDELNFFRVVERSTRTHGEALDPAQRLYDTISRRMKGRFSAGGLTLGKFILISSSQYPDDFIERRIHESEVDGSLGNTVKLIRKSLWEATRGVFVQGKPRFGDKTFRVETGTSKKNSRVLDDYSDKTGLVMPRPNIGMIEGEIVHPPVELYPDFCRDVEGSVRDFGGRVSRAITPFFTDSASVFEAERSELEHPWTKEETTLEDGSSLRVEQLFCKEEKTDRWCLVRHPQQLRYAAVDIGLTDCATGVSVVHVAGWQQVSRASITMVEPLFETDLMLRVVAPQGSEVKMAGIRTLFFNLRNLGMNFGKITYDSFQSRDSIQILTAKGFNVEVQSVNREIAPYNYLRDCFSEHRMRIYHYEPLLLEVPQLERRGDKIDHVPGGRKDLFDSLASSVWTAFQSGSRASPEELEGRLPYMKESASPQRDRIRAIKDEEEEMRKFMSGSRRVVR